MGIVMANKANRDMNRMLESTKMADNRNFRNMVGASYYFSFIIALLILGTIWYFAAHRINKVFIFPYLEDVLYELFYAVTDLYVIRSLGITMRRVLIGVYYATIIGFPLGMLMGYSPLVMRTIAPFINSLRQIPTTSWVPLAIVWFGLGDGPTIFVIMFHAIFTVILNTVAGVKSINSDFYNAARSMGAKTKDIVKDVILPGSLSGLITGVRIALGSAWMSVV
jgi:NitT/TauT family transport system permease protein